MTPDDTPSDNDQAKPRRRLIRPRNVILAIALLFVVGVVVLLIPVVRISTAVPGANPRGPEQLAELIERYQDPSARTDQPNGYEALFNALKRADEINARYCRLVEAAVQERFGDTASECVTLESLSDPQEPRAPFLNRYTADRDSIQAEYNQIHQNHARQYLAALEEAGVFDSLDQVAATRRAVPDTDFAGPMFLARVIDGLPWARQLARALEVRFLEQLDSGEPAEAARSLEQLLAMSRTLSHDPSMISYLVAIAIQHLADSAVLETLDSHRLDADTLEALLGAYDRQLPMAPWESVIEAQRLELLDLIEWTYSDDGNGSGYALPASSGAFTGAARSSIRNIPGLLLARKDKAILAVNESFDEWRDIASAPVAQRTLTPLGPDSPLNSKRLGTLSMLTGSAALAQSANDRCICITAGTFTRLAIEIHRARTGSLPATLEDLVPDLLPHVPLDFFAPDLRYRYIPLQGPDDHHRDYLLYSVAADGRDDNATPADTDRPTDAFSADHPGTDYLFTPPVR